MINRKSRYPIIYTFHLLLHLKSILRRKKNNTSFISLEYLRQNGISENKIGVACLKMFDYENWFLPPYAKLSAFKCKCKFLTRADLNDHAQSHETTLVGGLTSTKKDQPSSVNAVKKMTGMFNIVMARSYKVIS